MTNRISCCVPFCTHTRGDRKGAPLKPGDEWLCETHWKLVSKAIKRRRAKMRRLLKGQHWPMRRNRIMDIDDILWERAKKQAIERAAGI